MSENPCADFFEANRENNNFVGLLPVAESCISWESLAASRKPETDVVSDAEKVRRRIITPTHIDAAGKPTPLCFKDAFDKGLSVDRDHRPIEASIADAESWIEDQLAANPTTSKAFYGLAIAKVVDVRKIVKKGVRAFAVFNTALPDNPAHADVCAINNPDKTTRNDLRAELWREFNKEWSRA